MAAHVFFISFLFALGACVGSFLNVVVWRLPRVKYEDGDSLFRQIRRSFEALSSPPSHCPKCGKKLAWYDNVPVIGWIKLGGKCRWCREPISPKYPIVEAIAGLMFVLYYVLFFVFNIGPSLAAQKYFDDGFGHRIAMPFVLNIVEHWPMFSLYLFALAALLGASLIDLDHFIIPIEIPWLMAIVGCIVHAMIDSPKMPGALLLGPTTFALGVGGFVGWIASLMLKSLGVLKPSFQDGLPMLEVDKAKLGDDDPAPPEFSRKQLAVEMRKEIAFLLPPLFLAFAAAAIVMTVPAAKSIALSATRIDWLNGLVGAIFGGLIGAFAVWFTRIAGTLGFGREAMGLGDVHLMLGVGCIVGAGASVVAFFLAPFAGMAIAIWLLATSKRREIPYGPYLSLGSAAVMLFYSPIADYLSPGFAGLALFVGEKLGFAH